MTALPAEALLLAAVRAAPRRYLLPALPQDAAAAMAAGPETALAFGIEAACRGDDARQVFTGALAQLLVRAMQPHGDPALQALVLREEEADVAAYATLRPDLIADRRRVQVVVDAVAHPAKLRGRPPGPLAPLHKLARAGDWERLRDAAQLAPEASALLAEPALAHLVQAAKLEQRPAVQRYLSLLAAQTPKGANSADSRGRATEAEVLAAFATLARWLDARGTVRHRALSRLRPRSGYPVAGAGAKDEWDVALVREAGTGGVAIVLLAESKASPIAASADWPRLLRGLQRLAQPVDDPLFAAAEGEVRVDAASLRALSPAGDELPPQVLYCCTAHEAHAPVLAPSARALLLQQQACIAFARALARGEAAPPDQLAIVWDGLTRSGALRSVLHQDQMTRRAREAMLHPDDLLAAARAAIAPAP
jgi:hypothetical protein